MQICWLGRVKPNQATYIGVEMIGNQVLQPSQAIDFALVFDMNIKYHLFIYFVPFFSFLLFRNGFFLLLFFVVACARQIVVIIVIVVVAVVVVEVIGCWRFFSSSSLLSLDWSF